MVTLDLVVEPVFLSLTMTLKIFTTPIKKFKHGNLCWMANGPATAASPVKILKMLVATVTDNFKIKFLTFTRQS
jgi:hypothetical protein